MKKINEILRNILLIAICTLFILYIDSELIIDKNTKHIDINQNANLYINDKLVCVGDISNYTINDVKYGDEFVIEKNLESSIDKIINPVIGFNNAYNLAYEIRLDGKKIYEWGMDAEKNSMVCDDFVTVPLKGNELFGKSIRIKFKCIDENVFSRMPSLLVMNSKDLMKSFFIANIEYILISLTFLEIGVVLLIIMCINVLLRLFDMKNIYIALVSIFAGIWILFTYQINIFVYKNVKLDFYLEHIAFAATIFFMNLYVANMYKHEKKRERIIIHACNAALVVSTIIAIILQKMNLVYIKDSMVVGQILAFPIIILFMKKIISKIKDRDENSRRIISELIIFGVSIGIYFGINIIGTNENANLDNVILFAYLLLIGNLVGLIIDQMHNMYKISAERKSISRLAYLDPLTGLSNRRGLEVFVNKLKEKCDGKVYTVCSFDLNRLKYVNDKYGHAAGDTLIKDFAQILHTCVIDDVEYCGRMGGDEFLAIISPQRVYEFLYKVDKNIKQKNTNGENKYKIKYSVGTAEFLNETKSDINESIRMADYSMYDMKSIYKK